MSESIITDVYNGKYVLIQLVDTTVELTVENNIYSLTEALDLEQELQQAIYILKKNHVLEEATTYSQQMQEVLEPIDEDMDAVG